VSAGSSTGAAGRPFQVAWSLGSGSNVQLREQLKDIVSSATGLSLQISAPQFYAAVQAAKDSFSSDPVQLEFVVSVTNWLDQSKQASVFVSLESFTEEMPILSPASATTARIRSRDEVTFAVETGYANTSVCTNAASQARLVDITWEYRTSSTESWASLSSLDLTNMARQPSAIQFAGYSFSAGTDHEFRATARYRGSSPTAKAPEYIFRLNVDPAAPPVARVVGPTSTKSSCGFSLDASGSYDLSVPPGVAANLAYEWSCAADGANCSLSNFASSATDGSGSRGALLVVAGNQLVSGFYNFSVRVSRPGGTEAGVAEWTLEISGSDSALPPVAISAPWASGEAVSTQVGAALGPVTAAVQTSGAGCSVPDAWAWKFALVDVPAEPTPSNVMSFLSTTKTADGSGGFVLATSEFQGHQLVPGQRYMYAVVKADTETDMLSLQQIPGNNLEKIVSMGGHVVMSVPFVADGPPSGGLVQSNPQSGYAVTTAFSGITSGWYDEEVDSLTFAYYLLPKVQADLTLTADGSGGLVVTGTFQPPSVDWRNTGSTNYWSKLGGMFLANISDPSAAIWEVQVAAGEYIMAVVARDKLGAISAAFAPGPLVQAPPGGISPDLALASLDNALSSNNDAVLLGALNSLSSVALADADPAKLKEATDKKMEALGSAAGVVSTSSESLAKFGDVAANVLQSESTGGVASVEVAELASQALDTAMEAALSSSGVDESAGTSLLRAATSVSSSFAAGGGSSTQQGATAAKSRALFSKLGNALLQQLPVGTSTAISSVQDGKGTAIAVKSESAADASQNGLSGAGAQVPGSALGGRRLAECGTLALQETNYIGSNPFVYLNSSQGINKYVLSNATVSTIEIKRCDTLVSQTGLDPPVALNLTLNPMPANADKGYGYEPVCVRLLDDQVWTTEGMTRILPSVYDSPTIDCLAETAGGSYSAIYVPIQLPTTTATATYTSTRVERSTVAPVVEDAPPDTGIVVGMSMAGVALFVVCGLIAWQCWQGNVEPIKVEMPSMSCQKLQEALTWKSKRVDIEPSGPTGPGTEPTRAWDEKPGQPSATEDRHTQQDAEDHFWDWATDLAKKEQEGQQTAVVRSSSLGGRPGPGTPPNIPPRFSLPKPVAEKEEYFQNFAQELRDIVGTGVPGIADSPESRPSSPPPPPPKRPPVSTVLMPPPKPPPRSRESSVRPAALAALPPALTNAERIDVRVDQAFSDWANDFATASAVNAVSTVPSTPKDAPPPPPPRRVQNQLPLPPPRPPIDRRGSNSSKATPPTPPVPPSRGSSNPHDLYDLQPPLRRSANSDGTQPPPPPEMTAERNSALTPPSLGSGSQLSMSVPKQVPLQPPAIPKGGTSSSMPVELPGALASDQQTPRESS
ncbi:unnamed protein product, partial [Effrenium voratum]